jgi:hypothetical protein
VANDKIEILRSRENAGEQGDGEATSKHGEFE